MELGGYGFWRYIKCDNFGCLENASGILLEKLAFSIFQAISRLGLHSI